MRDRERDIREIERRLMRVARSLEKFRLHKHQQGASDNNPLTETYYPLDGAVALTGGLNVNALTTLFINLALQSSELASPTTGDVYADDGTNAAGLKILRRYNGSGYDDLGLRIDTLAAEASPDGAADYVAIYDASGAIHKKVLLNDLPGGGGDTHPVVDTTELVKGSADATKRMRVEVDGLTTATTRVLTMADQDISLVPGTHFADAAGDPGVDTTAIHDDTASEISAVTEKTTPVGADLLLMEDSAAANAKKRLQLTNLSALFLLLTGGTMAGDLTFSGNDIVMGAGDTVDGVDVSNNVAAVVAGSLRQDVTFEGGVAVFSSQSSKAVTMTTTFTGSNTYIANAVTNSGAGTYVIGVTHDSGTQITIYTSATYSGQVRWFAFGY